MWAAGGRDGVGARSEGSPEAHGQLTALPGLTWHPWDRVCHLCPRVLSLGSCVPYGLRCPSGTLRSHVGSCAPYGFTSSSICSCVHRGTACPRRAHVSPHGLTWPLWAHMSPIGSHPPWAHMSPRGLLEDPMGPRVLSGTMSASHVLTGTPWVHMSPRGIGVSYRPPCHLEAHVPPTSSPGPYGLMCPSRAPVAPTGSHATPWAPMSPMGSGPPPGALGCPLGHAPHGPSTGWALPDAGGC